jgi:hypothetical protein
MSLKPKKYPRAALRVIGGIILLSCVAVAGAQAEDGGAQPPHARLAAGLAQVPLTLVSIAPLLGNGQTVGAMAIYDDPSTPRRVDYLEVFDGGGALVAVNWFDRFGIERLIVDRALVEGGPELEGVFVAVVDGEVI